ncbi:MAG: hypothetical protein AAB433_17425 [Nitrospirota bacterium]
MTQDFLFERVADGLEIDQVDFMQCRYVLDSGVEFGELCGGEFVGSGDGDVDVGVRVGSAFWPGPEPDDLNVGSQHATCKIGYF